MRPAALRPAASGQVPEIFAANANADRQRIPSSSAGTRYRHLTAVNRDALPRLRELKRIFPKKELNG
jgi:hypothetical protein